MIRLLASHPQKTLQRFLNAMNFSYKKNKFIVVVIAIFAATICHARNEAKPPVEINFYPKNIGSTYTFQVEITEQANYSIELRLYRKMPSKLFGLFENESVEDSIYLNKILRGPEKTRSNNWIEMGMPAKFRVTIVNKENAIVFDEVVENIKTLPVYMGRYGLLAKKSLPQNLYKISIKYIHGAADLEPLHGKIVFAKAHHGK